MLFDSMSPEALQKAQEEANLEAMNAMRVFSEHAEDAAVVESCDVLTRRASELAEILELEPSAAVLAMLAGAALQRAQIVQARSEAAEPTAE